MQTHMTLASVLEHDERSETMFKTQYEHERSDVASTVERSEYGQGKLVYERSELERSTIAIVERSDTIVNKER
jgi:hypothetical protein